VEEERGLPDQTIPHAGEKGKTGRRKTKKIELLRKQCGEDSHVPGGGGRTVSLRHNTPPQGSATEITYAIVKR